MEEKQRLPMQTATPPQKKHIRNVNIEYRRKLRPADRFALWSAQHIGSMGFFFIIFFWTTLWFLWNTIAPEMFRFDPFPQFALWIFVSNTIQLMLMPLILVGQNLIGRHAEERAEMDYEINLKAEREVEQILERFDKQEKTLSEIIVHLKETHHCHHLAEKT